MLNNKTEDSIVWFNVSVLGTEDQRFKSFSSESIFLNMILLILIFLPFFGSIFSGLFGFFIGRKGSVLITTLTTFLSFIFSSIIFYYSIILNCEYILFLNNWITSGLFYCNWSFIFDKLTLIMLIIITSISSLIHLYSSYYMLNDPHISRFMSFLSLFTFFMLILVTGDNFIQMFVGWEGVGFCSYLLINFWFTRLQANKSSIKAMLVNKISDSILILAILTIFYNIKTVEYYNIFSIIIIFNKINFIIFNYQLNIINIICILILIGAMGKSAQIFLHIWLPDAMEGPTPVSALIHAATMVTAGIYIITRCSPLFEYSNISLKIIIIMGSLTAFFASTIGLTQNDFKKIIAYSTCSQLGYMFLSCGLSNYPLAMFHLTNHAYFKALLFLCSGVIIHVLNDEQDIRKMGGLKKIMPFSYITFLIGSLSLMGFPFLSGFYSKDLILENCFSNFNQISHFAFWLGLIGAFFTSFYSIRLLFFVFLSETNLYKNIVKNIHDVVYQMGIPLGILAFFSIFSGYLLKDMFVGLGTNFWNNSIFINPLNTNYIDTEFLNFLIKILPIFFSFLGIIIAFFLYNYKQKMLLKFKISKLGLNFYNFFNKKWYFDKIYNEFINQKILKIGLNYSYKKIDKGLIEFFGPYGLIFLFSNLSRKLILLQTGFIYHYSLLIFINIIFLFSIIFFFIFFKFNFILFILLFFIFLSLKLVN